MLLEGVVVVSRELLDPRGGVGREPVASGQRAGFSEVDKALPNLGGKACPQPGLVHRLALH